MMIEIPAEIWATLLATFFGFLGAGFATWINDRHRKTERTYDLHREFHSGEVSMARATGYDFAAKIDNPDEMNLKFHDYLVNGANDFGVVASFYMRLYIGIDTGNLDKSLILRLFGGVFVHWYLILFRDKLPKTWEVTPYVDSLYEWINDRVKQEASFRYDPISWLQRHYNGLTRSFQLKQNAPKRLEAKTQLHRWVSTAVEYYCKRYKGISLSEKDNLEILNKLVESIVAGQTIDDAINQHCRHLLI
jgi:hypothetical protein